MISNSKLLPSSDSQALATAESGQIKPVETYQQQAVTLEEKIIFSPPQDVRTLLESGKSFVASSLSAPFQLTGEETHAGSASSQPQKADGSANNSWQHFITFSASNWEFFILCVRTTLLCALTGGLCYDWSRTEIREYLWERTKIDNFVVIYTGTGWELFKRNIVVAIKQFLIFLLLSYAFSQGMHLLLKYSDITKGLSDSNSFYTYLMIENVITAFLLLLIFAGSSFRRKMTELSLLKWRGKQLSVHYSAFYYSLRAVFTTTLLYMFTGGIAISWIVPRLLSIRINSLRFGTGSPFVCVYRGTTHLIFVFLLSLLLGIGGLWGGWVMLPPKAELVTTLVSLNGWLAFLAICFAIVTAYSLWLLFSSFWRASLFIWAVKHTHLGLLQFSTSLSRWKFIGMRFMRCITQIFSFGLLIPFGILWERKMLLESLQVSDISLLRNMDYIYNVNMLKTCLLDDIYYV